MTLDTRQGWLSAHMLAERLPFVGVYMPEAFMALAVVATAPQICWAGDFGHAPR